MTTINQITKDDIDAFLWGPTLNAYQDVAGRSAIYPGQGTFLGLMYVNAKLNGEAGEFSENVGKALRDDDILIEINRKDFAFGKLSDERRFKLKRELGDVLWYVAAAARELGYDLSEIAEDNLVKLQDRTERSALQGSGDDR